MNWFHHEQSGYTDGAVLVFLLFTALFGYWFSTLFIPPFQSGVSGAQLVATSLIFIFWGLLVLLFLGVALRGMTRAFLGVLRRRLWARILFPAYMAVHLIAYGLVLERIFVLATGSPQVSIGGAVYLAFSYYFSPHTLANALLQITQTPSLVIVVPPFYGVTLGPFAAFSALSIGMLVTVHIDRLITVSGRLRRAGGSVVYPAVGVVAGASCCVSLPDIAATSTPLSAVIFATPLWTTVLYALYYLLPVSVIAAFTVTLMPLMKRGRPK